ncbi:hypothetical protein DTO013E5_6121 [Penicillium roqueforti]|nr:hypothetical protein CBS147355_2549 [Penicillium roqueforti]KAI2695744.1 hypothetical protein CBS147372_8853 [Penicillium roqueforti]KAI2734116.1 hypothetical protein DTO013F2_10410 [Penicillium roqueforti]KAI2736266.1 hypothetical protein DTO012A1_8444 [Penicillium roqueforti]KAI3149894.1 hypothetical protein CBS147317_7880 [Penicillium roqueforti]
MSENSVTATAQSLPQMFSRYRGMPGATTGDVEMAAPPAPVHSIGEQNPSIARSRSRYHRNRPQSSGNVAPPPAIPGYARTQLEQRGELRQNERAATSRPLAEQDEEEEEAREVHRQGAMEQLTGGEISAQQPRSEPVPARPPHSSHSSNDEHRKSFFQKVKLSRSKVHLKRTESPPRYIGVGGTGIVPGVDAPVSAVNAGERHAVVRYGDAVADLTVTPSTQVRDLLLDATKHLSRDIDADRFILMESFSQVGLERPLRRYEHVREVMNSWSHDAENQFIVIPPSSVEALAQLDAGNASSGPPSPVTVHIYHSQRRRKWDKRYVTLRADGQVTISKKEDTEETNICHISDYDIYFPSARALNKDIKPPKKLCFAIKSQQKSSMFLSTENFLHFFSTSDKSIADTWYRAVQKWRSWYLVNKKGAAQKAETEKLVQRAGTKKSTHEPRNVYNEVPLLERETSAESSRRESSDQRRPTSSKEYFARKKTLRGYVPPPPSYSQTMMLDAEMDGPFGDRQALISGISSPEEGESAFAPSGLLGRTYTQRQNAMREREDRDKRAKQEAFSGVGFMSGGSTHTPGHDSNPNSRTNTMTRAPDSSNFTRTPSLKQKPLVDLTPVFVEPPQHSRKGKGRGVKVQPGMQLIDAATGPDQPPGGIAIPPATSWRRPAADTTPQRRNTARSVRHHSNKYAAPISSEGSPEAQFTANSLLAHSASTTSHWNPRTGHGVATGDRNATRPLLDMSPENPFADGSLLRQL